MDDAQLRHQHLYNQVNVSGGFAVLGNQYNLTQTVDGNLEQQQWQRLLDSLWYAEMNQRLNDIADNAYDTFEWVFNDLSDDSHPGSEILTEWLTQENGVLLVQGKAGSGKSTFSKFVFQHDETRGRLQTWAAGRPLATLFHSFWRVGAQLQQNFKGFLATLLMQVLEQTLDCTRITAIVSKYKLKKSLNDWSIKELRKLLLQVLNEFPGCVSIFVDGFDEFDQQDDIDKLHDFLIDLQTNTIHYKLYVSTRPIPSIVSRFEDATTLQLPELTKSDIEEYVKRTLEAKLRPKPFDEEKNWQISTITQEMCAKADGVFLWVHYVLHNICGGIRIGDDLSALLKRIRQLPSAIQDLYRQMWNLQNTDNAIHGEEAAMIFGSASIFRYLYSSLQCQWTLPWVTII